MLLDHSGGLIVRRVDTFSNLNTKKLSSNVRIPGNKEKVKTAVMSKFLAIRKNVEY